MPVRQGLLVKPENALSDGDCYGVRARNVPWTDALRIAHVAERHVAGTAGHTHLL